MRQNKAMVMIHATDLRGIEKKRWEDIREELIQKKARRLMIDNAKALLYSKYKRKSDRCVRGCHSCLFKGCDGLLCSFTGKLHSDEGVCEHYVKERWEVAI